MTNDALFVDQESGAIAEALFFVENSVVLNHRAFEITQQRKRNANLFGKLTISGNAVHAQSKYLRFSSFEFGDTSLVRLQFLRSTTGERQHIHGEHHILGALEVA